MGFPDGSGGKDSACNQETWVQSLGQKNPLGGGNGYRLWYVLLPTEFHGQRSLVGYSPWGHKESDMTEHTEQHSNVKLTQTFLEKMNIF